MEMFLFTRCLAFWKENNIMFTIFIRWPSLDRFLIHHFFFYHFTANGDFFRVTLINSISRTVLSRQGMHGIFLNCYIWLRKKSCLHKKSLAYASRSHELTAVRGKEIRFLCSVLPHAHTENFLHGNSTSRFHSFLL